MFKKMINPYVYIKIASILLCSFILLKFALNNDIFSKGYFYYGGERFGLIWFLVIFLSLIFYILSNLTEANSYPRIYLFLLIIVFFANLFILYYGIMVISGILSVLSINDLILFKKTKARQWSILNNM